MLRRSDHPLDDQVRERCRIGLVWSLEVGLKVGPVELVVDREACESWTGAGDRGEVFDGVVKRALLPTRCAGAGDLPCRSRLSEQPLARGCGPPLPPGPCLHAAA